MTTVLEKFDINIDSDGNPLLEGGYAPIDEEIVATDFKVIGDIPDDIACAYVRNGPNQRHQPSGRFHIFDGDGMLHAMRFENGELTYRNRFIRTEGFLAEAEAGQSIWPGLMDMPNRSLEKGWGSHHWLKDVSNTDVVPFNGKLLTTFYQCGVPYIVDAETLETQGPIDADGMKIRQVSAHSRTDLNTGEFIFFDYDVTPPYMTYGVLNPKGGLKHFTDITLPGPRLPHDMAITPNYSILMDLPLFWDPELLKRDIHKVTFFPEMPSRFAILPRYGSDSDVRWFEADPCYIYHVINAWEDGDEIILDACRMRTPEPPAERLVGGKYASLIAWGALDAQYYRWRFNMKTGETREGAVDDQYVEFPTINQYRQGLKTSRSYHVHIPQGEPLRMGGVIAFDTDTGARDEYLYEKNVYGSEPVFAPRKNAKSDTDGYVMTFVEDMNADGRTELHIFDPMDISGGPVTRIEIPHRMPMGFHACWAPNA